MGNTKITDLCKGFLSLLGLSLTHKTSSEKLLSAPVLWACFIFYWARMQRKGQNGDIGFMERQKEAIHFLDTTAIN